MSNKKILFITLLSAILIVLIVGCASQQDFVSHQTKVYKEPNPLAINHFIDGVISDINQNFAAALLSYQEALLYDSTSSGIYLAIGKDYLRLGKTESALISLKRSLRLNPREIEARELIAKIYLHQRKWKLAEKTNMEILSQDSTRIESYYNLALIYLQRNEGEKAAKMYRHILSLQQVPDPQILLGLGELYMNLEHFKKAADVYHQLINLNPNEGFGYYGLGTAIEAMGDTARAVENYSRALQLTPNLLEARDRLSQIYLARHEWNKALHIYLEAVKKDSTDIPSWLEIADIYQTKKDTTSALKTLDQIKHRFPKDWRAYLNKGRILLDQQKFALACSEFKKVVKLAPKIAWGWLFTGISLVHLDSLKQSQPYLKKALEIAPNDPLGNYYLGSVFSQLNQPGNAIPYLKTALKVRPNWVSALGALANAYDNLKEYTIADSLFQTALRLAPENALILNNYGYSLAEQGIKLEEAMKMVEKALKKEPKNGAYLDTMGWIYFKMCQYQKALEYIEKASLLRGNSAEVIKHLGDVYEKLGMKEKARNAWEKALKLDKNNQEILKKLHRQIKD